MNDIAETRSQIYDRFHSSSACQKHFFQRAYEPDYVAYYNSMYLLQDSTESLMVHRERGFSTDAHMAYLEFWGLMQALVIQQDAISEIYGVMIQAPLDAKAKGLTSWLAIRNLRNICAGHPAKRDRPNGAPLTRTFMGRAFGNYNAIQYEQWQDGGNGRTHPSVNLGRLIDSYALEANVQLTKILTAMKQRWP